MKKKYRKRQTHRNQQLDKNSFNQSFKRLSSLSSFQLPFSFFFSTSLAYVFISGMLFSKKVPNWNPKSLEPNENFLRILTVYWVNIVAVSHTLTRRYVLFVHWIRSCNTYFRCKSHCSQAVCVCTFNSTRTWSSTLCECGRGWTSVMESSARRTARCVHIK